jgi:hypothetical protein
MVKSFLIIVTLLLLSSSAWSFEYAGIGVGPAISMKGNDGTHLDFQGEWQPNKVVGTKLILGFSNGFWMGVALNLNQNLSRMFKTSHWDANFSIPFIYNLRLNSRTAFVGFTVGTTFSFDIDGRGLRYIYLTPVEIRILPFVWGQFPSQGWSTSMNVAYLCMVGFRTAI